MKDFPIMHRKLRANDIELHLAESGDANAPLLILLHGFPEFWFAWRDYMSSLAASGFRTGFHCVGACGKPASMADWARSSCEAWMWK